MTGAAHFGGYFLLGHSVVCNAVLRLTISCCLFVEIFLCDKVVTNTLPVTQQTAITQWKMN